VEAPPRRRRIAALALAAVLAAACGGEARIQRTEFWLEAAADPEIAIDPPAALPTDATLAMRRWEGVVVDHRPAEGVGRFEIDLLVNQGGQGTAVTLRYSVGLGRRLPVERTRLVEVRVWQDRQPPAAPVRALAVINRSPTLMLRDGAPIAIVQANGLIPGAEVPAALRRITQTDEVAYQSADRTAGDCLTLAVHRRFSVPADDRDRLASRDPMRYPGTRLQVADRAHRFDVLLGDHREVLSSECPDAIPAYWVWSAVIVPPPASTRARLEAIAPSDDGDDGAAGNVSIALPATATDAPPARTKGGRSPARRP